MLGHLMDISQSVLGHLLGSEKLLAFTLYLLFCAIAMDPGECKEDQCQR